MGVRTRWVGMVVLATFQLCVLSACGPGRATHWTLISGTLREHSIAIGTDICLIWDFECVHFTGGREVWFVATVDGVEDEGSVRYGMSGDGRSGGGFLLPGTYFIDGDRAKLAAIRAKIVWPTSYSTPVTAGMRAVVFEYEDLAGKKVRLELRS